MRLFFFVVTFLFAVYGNTQNSRERADAIYEHYIDRLYELIDIHFHGGDFYEVIRLQTVLKGIYPDDAQLNQDYIWMLGNVEQHEDALREAIAFRKKHPEILDGYLTEAMIYRTRNLPQRIPALLEPILDKADHQNYFVLLAWAYEKMGLLKEAIRIHELRVKRNLGAETATMNIQRIKEKINQMKEK